MDNKGKDSKQLHSSTVLLKKYTLDRRSNLFPQSPASTHKLSFNSKTLGTVNQLRSPPQKSQKLHKQEVKKFARFSSKFQQEHAKTKTFIAPSKTKNQSLTHLKPHQLAKKFRSRSLTPQD